MVPSLLFLILVCSVAWRRMWKRRVVAGLSAAALFLYCWVPSALVVARLWEMKYAPVAPADAATGAIVVLAGAVHGPTRPVRDRILGRETYVRSVYAAQLSSVWPDVPVVVTGGRLEEDLPPYAQAMRDELVRRGVRADRIWVEGRSRTTYENAVYTSELLRARGIAKIVLVTSASHMRRAEATFRRQGFEVSPAACAFYSIYTLEPPDFLWPHSTALGWNDSIVHEMLGFAWYRLKGRL